MKNTFFHRYPFLLFTVIVGIATAFPSHPVFAQQRSQYDLAAWMNAAQYDNDTASVNWALKEGLHIDYRRGWGNGLHLAIFHKRPMMVKFLLSKGASVDALTEEGLTALQLAEKIGDQEIIDILKTKKGLSPAGGKKDEKELKTNTGFAPGSKVEILWNGKWYAGHIKERRGKELKVHYDGWDDTWDEWVKEDKLRLPGATTNSTAPVNVTRVKGAVYSVGQQVLFSPDRGKRWEKGIVLTVSADPLLATDGIPVYRIENLEKSISGYYDVCYITTLERQPTGTSFFIGDWDLYLPMTVTERVIDRDVYKVYSGADRLPPLRINADNTYSWVMDKKKVIRGKWKPNTDGPGIILLKGDGGTDWYMYSNADASSNKVHKTDQVRMVSEPHGTPRHGFRIRKK